MPPPSGRPTAAAGNLRLLGDATRLGIINALRTTDRTVDGLAATTGMHRNTVRSHLARLIAAGIVETAGRAPAGRGRPTATRGAPARGRPAHTFRLVQPAQTGHQAPFTEGLLALVRLGHGDSAAGAAEAQGRAAGKALTAGAPARSDAQAVEATAEAMRKLAFEPEVQRQRGGYRIDVLHCPYWGNSMSGDGEILCGFHRGLMQGMLDATRPGRFTVRLLPLVEQDPCRCEVQLRLSPGATEAGGA